MYQAAPSHRASPLLFAGVVAGVYAGSLAVVGQLPHLDRANPVAIGLTLDMVVIVPLAFYLLVVRPRNVPIITLAPVFGLSVVAASRVLPADHQGTLRIVEALAVPLELGLIGWIGWRAKSALRKARGDKGGDPLEQFSDEGILVMAEDFGRVLARLVHQDDSPTTRFREQP